MKKTIDDLNEKRFKWLDRWNKASNSDREQISLFLLDLKDTQETAEREQEEVEGIEKKSKQDYTSIYLVVFLAIALGCMIYQGYTIDKLTHKINMMRLERMKEKTDEMLERSTQMKEKLIEQTEKANEMLNKQRQTNEAIKRRNNKIKDLIKQIEK